MADDHIPTYIDLGGVVLGKCAFNLPVHVRGTAYPEWKITQNGTRLADFEKLREAQKADGFPGHVMTLKSRSAKGPRERKKGGIFITNIVREHMGQGGLTITLSDPRWLLKDAIFPLDFNLMHRGKYLAETANGTDFPISLHAALRKLQDFRPLFGRMALEWDLQLPTGLLVPDNQKLSGKGMAKGLQALLETWAFDLDVTNDGKFYFPGRICENGEAVQQGLIAKGETFIWKRKPARKRVALGVPRTVYVPFEEMHTLQAPILGGLFGETAGSLEISADGGASKALGVYFRQVYKALGTFFELPDMLLANQFKADDLHDRTDRPTEKNVSHQFMHTFMQGTPADPTQYTSKDDRNRATNVLVSIQESHRNYFALFYVSGNGQGPMWLDVELGKQTPTGEIRPAHAEGDYTEILGELKDEDVRGEWGAVLREWPDRWALAQFQLVREHRGQVTDPDKVKDKDEVNRRAKLVPTMPLFVDWKHKAGGVIQLIEDDKLTPGTSRAIIGLPKPGGIPSLNVALPGTKYGDKVFKEILAKANVKVSLSLEDLEMDSEYVGWVYITAKRNFPNGLGKYWWLKLQGDPNGDIEYAILEPDATVFARRNFVDYADTKSTNNQKVTKPGDRAEFGPFQDGLGPLMNRDELDAVALRKRDAYMAVVNNQSAPGEEDFFNYAALDENFYIGGDVDGAYIKVSEDVIMGTIVFGPRANDRVKYEESLLRQAKRIASLSGRKLG